MVELDDFFNRCGGFVSGVGCSDGLEEQDVYFVRCDRPVLHAARDDIKLPGTEVNLLEVPYLSGLRISQLNREVALYDQEEVVGV